METETPLEKMLLASLQRTIDWLKYAEAKNGALLTLASAWTIAGGGILNSIRSVLSTTSVVTLCIALIMFALAMFTALSSFSPKMNINVFIGWRRSKPEAGNLLYFGDVAETTIWSFPQALHDRYFTNDARCMTRKYLDDLAAQVHINSQICKRKMNIFQRGLALLFVGAFVLTIPFVEWITYCLRG